MNAHHRDAETPHAAKPEGSVDLWEVLNRREDRSENAEEISPGLHGRRVIEGKCDREDDCHQSVEDTDGTYGQGGVIGVAVGGRHGADRIGRGGRAREIGDKEEKTAGSE